MKNLKLIFSFVLILALFAGCAAKPVNSELSSSFSTSEKETASQNEDNTESKTEAQSEQTATTAKSSSNTVSVTKKSAETKSNNTTSKKNDVSLNTTTKRNTVSKPNTTITANTTTKQSTTENNAGYSVEVLNCSNDGKKIFGKIYKPNKNRNAKMPAVILSHSFMLNSHSLLSYAKLFAENGFVAYVFDFCGGSTNSNSDGKMSDMTVFTEVSDLEAVMNEIRGLDFVDKSKLFLFGTSQGGLVSALTASKHPSQVKGLVLLYPGFNMNEAVKGNSQMAGMVLSQKYIDAIKDYDIYGNITGFKGDVLIIHGTADTQVDIKYSEKAVKIYNSAKLEKIKGANHGFNSANNFGMGGNYDKEVNPHIINFVKSHI